MCMWLLHVRERAAQRIEAESASVAGARSAREARRQLRSETGGGLALVATVLVMIVLNLYWAHRGRPLWARQPWAERWTIVKKQVVAFALVYLLASVIVAAIYALA
jgi:hypothetical protein